MCTALLASWEHGSSRAVCREHGEIAPTHTRSRTRRRRRTRRNPCSLCASLCRSFLLDLPPLLLESLLFGTANFRQLCRHLMAGVLELVVLRHGVFVHKHTRLRLALWALVSCVGHWCSVRGRCSLAPASASSSVCPRACIRRCVSECQRCSAPSDSPQPSNSQR